jgi:hypothetical protein
VLMSGTREAEMAKLLENTYRHVNIALVNEMAIFCDLLGVDIWEKWDLQMAYGAFLAESAFDGKSGNLAQRATASIRREWP